MNYHISTKSKLGFAELKDRVKGELVKEGFGIITEIDMNQTLKKKLGVDFRDYIILGACNPKYAYKALSVEDKVGTMLPCNVVIQRLLDSELEVSAVDPVASMIGIENPELRIIAEEVREKLSRVIASL